MAESADRVAIAFDPAQIRKAQDRNPFVKISDIVYDILSEAILSSTIAPGSKLNISSIAENLNISHTPVFQAVDRLKNSGLIVESNETSKYHSYRVLDISNESLTNLFTARKAIETTAASICATNVALIDIAQLKKMAAEFRTVWSLYANGRGTSADFADRETLDRAFHNEIVLATENNAIILKKSSLVDNLLDSQVWDDACPFRKEDSASRVYDYNVLAGIVGFPGQINLIKKTSKAVASQIRSLRAIEKQLIIQRKKLDFQNATRLTLQRAIYNASHATTSNQYEQEEKIESAKVKLENLNEAIEYTKEKIADLESSLDEISAEIEDLIGTVRAEADQTADDIKNSGDAFVRYLYRLFTDADMLCHVLSHSEEGCRLYSYNGFIFASPADVSIDLPFRIADLTHGSTYQREANKEHSEQRYSSSKGQQHSQQASSESSTEHTRKKKSDEPIQRPYGKNWFSPQAHSDMKTLTKEYHRLAKQYHPDVCEHSRSQEIFQEILTERAEILEHMAQ